MSRTTLFPEESPSLHVQGSEPGKQRRPSTAQNDSSTAQEQLKKKGFIPILWYGKCDAEKVSRGTYTVSSGQGGMYGLVFDNTFSKQVSKTATFVLLTYPSNTPPNTTHHLSKLQGGPNAMASAVSIGNKGNRAGATASDSVDSLHSHSAPASASRSASVIGYGDNEAGFPNAYHVGLLLKRRRKRGQGYARRYFSLDFASCTLSYYYNRNSSALRGAIPLSLAAITADERRREISIDSGAEVWHLKAPNAKDFTEWTEALEGASNTARGIAPPIIQPSNSKVGAAGILHRTFDANPKEEREWEQVEALVSRIVGIRDAVRRLTKDTNLSTSPGSMLVAEERIERRHFWKRKVSPSTPRLFDRSLASQSTASVAPTVTTSITTNGSSTSTPRNRKRYSLQEQSIHDHCASLLNDLDSVLSEFSNLISNSKRRRMPVPLSAVSRKSADSVSTAEFYDAEAGDQEGSQLMIIQRQSGDDTPQSVEDDDFVSETTSISSTGGGVGSSQLGSVSLFPQRVKSLAPLPVTVPIKRRKIIPPPRGPPPSLISFVRKNVGKDLSTISMPVSSNEPISLLQRCAESLEYASLLDIASQLPDVTQRLLRVTAFAVSYFSNGRSRERALRKPFNPMLGETYELIRGTAEDPGNFRFLAEKISHRPVKIACQADSPNWSFAHSPLPSQQFWGKSAEITTDGRVRIVLRLQDGSDERYSWNVATVFLRNVVMGDKYVEPVGTMSVVSESSGAKATIEFKSKGMFGGRSEDVIVESYDNKGTHTGLGLTGTWTNSLRLVENGKSGPEIWKVGKLVDGADSHYGLTEFAAQLNEITSLEEAKTAITDSRLRRDQRAYEKGLIDLAEAAKASLENRQRERRREMEEKGVQWKPRWFVNIDGGDEGEDVWKLRSGKEGYWEERAKGIWTAVEDVLGDTSTFG
jgi:oxysterol-binding protein-related protein 3/6/7